MNFKVVLFFLAFIGCIFCGCSDYGPKQMNEDRSMYSVIGQTAKELNEKHNLLCIGAGGGSGIDNKIDSFNVMFQTQNFFNQDEARQLILECAETLVANIDNDEALRPSLKYYPYKIDKVSITILIRDEEGDDYYDPYLGAVLMYSGKIEYCTNDPEDRFQYKSIIEETYEEAVEKARGN